MRLWRGDQEVSAGSGAACLGDPAAAVAWLAATARTYGQPLRAGEIVLSGALGPMVPVAAGDRFTADIGGLGRVAAVFAGSAR
jgi:2-keto-4-pentenoate hydratase